MWQQTDRCAHTHIGEKNVVENPRTSQAIENRNRGIKERQIQRSERRAHCSSMYSCCSGGGQGAKRWPQHEGQRREKSWSEEECGQALGKVWRLLLSRAGRARPLGREEEGGVQRANAAQASCVSSSRPDSSLEQLREVWVGRRVERVAPAWVPGGAQVLRRLVVRRRGAAVRLVLR